MHFDSHSTEVCSQVSNWQQFSIGSDTRSSPTLQWRHNERDGVSNHQPHQCLPNRLFRRRSKKTSKLRVTGLCAENSPATGEFPARMTSNAENVSIWWRLRGAEQAINPYLNLRVTRHWWVNNMVWICVITLFHCIILIDFSFIKITQSLTDRRECHNNPISVVLNSTIKTFLVSLPDLTNFILFTIPLPQSFQIKSANKYYTPLPLQWRHNVCDGVWNHQPHGCSLIRVFRRRSKKYQSSVPLAVVRGIHWWPDRWIPRTKG